MHKKKVALNRICKLIILGTAALLAHINSFAIFGFGEDKEEKAKEETVQVPTTYEQINYSFAPLVKSVSPSVVNIYTKVRVIEKSVSPFFNDPLFNEFFGSDFFPHQYKERVQNSLGSGVIVDKSGLIITNYHVVQSAEDITVVLSDSREFKGKLVSYDKKLDMALISCPEFAKEKNVQELELVNSDSVEVGDLVLAIGNPYGLGQTVTSGIISGLARSTNGSDAQYYIQTDAAINPGNSGGALVNNKGQLIGINTAIFTQSGGSQGLGFAIPSNLVKSFVYNTDVEKGIVMRPWSGITAQDLTYQMSESLSLKNGEGVVIKSISQHSPFRQAGIKEGDVITKIEGKGITSLRDFEYRISTAYVGKTIKVEYFRSGSTSEVEVKLIEAPQIPQPEYTPVSGNNILSGSIIANLSPYLAQKHDLNYDAIMQAYSKTHRNIVVIDEVDEESIAGRYGIKSGDIVMSYNGVNVISIKELQKIISSQKGAHWDITLLRGDQYIRMRG